MAVEDPGPGTLTIDLGAGTGPFHGGASGTSYGPYGDVHVQLPGLHRGFPEVVRRQVEHALTLGESASRIVYVPFGEPEGHGRVSWRTDPRPYFAAWQETYRLIKGLHPGARVAGPDTGMSYPEVRGFLEFAKEHGVVPDVITWHAHDHHLSVPGRMVQWIAAIEESKVDSDLACRDIDGKGTGQWWLFNAYGRMTGTTVRVIAPRTDVQHPLQGVATLDTEKRQSRLLFGGAGGTANVVFANVDPEVFGATVHVRLDELRWAGRVGASGPPLRMRDDELPVVDGMVALPLTGLDEMSAYHLILSPGGHGADPLPPEVRWRRTYEAEDATCTGGGHSKNGPEDGLRTGFDGVLTFDVEVPQDGTYDISVYAGSHNQADPVREQGPTHVFLRVDGERPRELLLPLGHGWAVRGHTEADLTAGGHRITLAAQDPDLGAARGDAVIDGLDLTLRATEGPAPYDAEYADLRDGARVSHAHRGASGPGVAVLPRGGTATFWVHAADDGEATVTVERLGPGEGVVTVDGEAVGRVEEGPLPLFLAGGINKITVTGTSERLIVDRLRVGPSRGLLPGTSYAAEDGVLTGTAKVTALPYATGGKAVDGIGGGPGNALTLTVTARHAGPHALTIRYSNGEQTPATRYNPDPVCRHADLTVNDGTPHRILFPTTFDFNAFRTLTVPVTLVQGANTLTFTVGELPAFDGEFRNAHDRGPACAPVIDRVTVTPLTVPR
ncbi:cellulosome protein [Streptomyces sp. HD]|uniref:cellulosome protein n=1 Tax=Streptomyces sp. HD TaxID=3020892 RepID=UPI00232F45FE|nr:cellulosome protein [Streptomyces sp. HD]MDC0766962.1 cellulosome protein [Streptomyces sp. HD]